jgi:hypothetical protein
LACLLRDSCGVPLFVLLRKGLRVRLSRVLLKVPLRCLCVRLLRTLRRVIRLLSDHPSWLRGLLDVDLALRLRGYVCGLRDMCGLREVRLRLDVLRVCEVRLRLLSALRRVQRRLPGLLHVQRMLRVRLHLLRMRLVWRRMDRSGVGRGGIRLGNMTLLESLQGLLLQDLVLGIGSGGAAVVGSWVEGGWMGICLRGCEVAGGGCCCCGMRT